jgi:hypothetical protein
METNTFPIDIHLAKLLGILIYNFKIKYLILLILTFVNYFQDWILDRRHCVRDWSKTVLPIRTKINLAIQDMPENEEIKDLLSGSSKNFI